MTPAEEARFVELWPQGDVPTLLRKHGLTD
jgi:hypothetical protein